MVIMVIQVINHFIVNHPLHYRHLLVMGILHHHLVMGIHHHLLVMEILHHHHLIVILKDLQGHQFHQFLLLITIIMVSIIIMTFFIQLIVIMKDLKVILQLFNDYYMKLLKLIYINLLGIPY